MRVAGVGVTILIWVSEGEGGDAGCKFGMASWGRMKEASA